MVSKYVGDLDTSLLFVSVLMPLAYRVHLNSFFLSQAGLFSAVTASFIGQIIPESQSDPADLTNVLHRILKRNTSDIPTSVVRVQSILFVNLSVTLFVALIAALGKQWILYYTRITRWGNIVDRGKEHQAKLVGLQKWGLHIIMESLPIMLQFSLLLLTSALVIYLWDLDISAAETVLVVSLVVLSFYVCIAVAAAIWSDCPFQTPFSILLPKILPWGKELTAIVRVSLRRWSRRRAAALLLQIRRVEDPNYVTNSLERVARTFTGWTNTHTDGRVRNNDYHMTLSNPSLWRQDPLFTSPFRRISPLLQVSGCWRTPPTFQLPRPSPQYSPSSSGHLIVTPTPL